MLTLTPFARFENWRISWEGSTFCGKVGKRLESGAIDMPQVCEGCTAKTKPKLLAKRGAFFATPRSGLAGASSLMLFYYKLITKVAPARSGLAGASCLLLS